VRGEHSKRRTVEGFGDILPPRRRTRGNEKREDISQEEEEEEGEAAPGLGCNRTFDGRSDVNVMKGILTFD